MEFSLLSPCSHTCPSGTVIGCDHLGQFECGWRKHINDGMGGQGGAHKPDLLYTFSLGMAMMRLQTIVLGSFGLEAMMTSPAL